MDKNKSFKKKKTWLEGPGLELEVKKVAKDIFKKEEEKKREEEEKTENIEEEFALKKKRTTWKTELVPIQLPKDYTKELYSPRTRPTPKPREKPVDPTSTKEGQEVKPIVAEEQLAELKVDTSKDLRVAAQEETKEPQSIVYEFTTSPIEQTSRPEDVSQDSNFQDSLIFTTVTGATEEMSGSRDLPEDQVVEDETSKTTNEQTNLEQELAKDTADQSPVADEPAITSNDQDTSPQDLVDRQAVVDETNPTLIEPKPKFKGLRPVTADDYRIEPFRTSKRMSSRKDPSQAARYRDYENEEVRLRGYLKVKPKKEREFYSVYEKKKKKY